MNISKYFDNFFAFLHPIAHYCTFYFKTEAYLLLPHIFLLKPIRFLKSENTKCKNACFHHYLHCINSHVKIIQYPNVNSKRRIRHISSRFSQRESEIQLISPADSKRLNSSPERNSSPRGCSTYSPGCAGG